MKFRSRWIFAIALVIQAFMATRVSAQPKEFFNFPASIHKPKWFQQLDWNRINVFKNDSLIQKYYENEKLEEEVEGEEREEFEEPYREAYRRWFRSIQPYIQPDGSLDYSKGKTFLNLQRGLNYSSPSGNWTFLGPNETYNENGTGKKANKQANVYAIAIDPNNPSVLYCGTETGAIFKSNNKGQRWASVSDQYIFDGSATSIAVSKWTQNTVFATADKLVKSSDGGTTWNKVTTYAGGRSKDVEINPSSDRVYVASTYDKPGIYISDNGGDTWRVAQGSDLGNIYDIAINAVNNNIVYAVGVRATKALFLLTSTDGGSTFKETTGGLTTIVNNGARLGVSIADGSVAYCIVLDDNSPKLLKSTNSGQSWNIRVVSTGTGLIGTNINIGLGMSNGQGYYDLDIVVSPKNVNHLIVGTTSAFKSTDGGLNFAPLGGYMGPFDLHPDMQSMKANGEDTYIANDGGVNYSSDFFTDVANHDIRNYGISASDFWGFSQGWSEDLIVGGRYHNGNMALFENYGRGVSNALGGGEDATGHVLPGYKRTAIFADIGSWIVPNTVQEQKVSTFSNAKWPNDDYYGAFSSRLVTDPRYRNVFYLGGNRSVESENKTLWKSFNSGGSYSALYTFSSKLWRFDISRTNTDIMVACTGDGVYRTTNAGQSWNKLNLPSGVNYAFYNSDVVISPSNQEEIFLCMAQGASANKVFKSMDGGATWINYTGSALAGLSVAFLQADGTSGGIYAITNQTPSKIFYRNNKLSDWIDFSNKLPVNVQAKKGGLIFFRDEKIRIAGNRGVWESPLYASPDPVAQPMADKYLVDCYTDPVNFFDYSILNYKGASWKWDFPGAASVTGANTANPSVFYNVIGRYDVSLTVQDANGKVNTHLVKNMIQVVPNTCVAAIGGITRIKVGCDATLTDATAGGVWSSANTNIATISQAGLLSGRNVGQTIVSYTVAGVGVATTLVIVSANTPAPVLTASGPVTFCQGGSVVLRSSPASSYLWNTGETGQSITVSTTGSYWVKTSDICAGSAQATPINVFVNPLPPKPTISVNGAVLTSSASTGNYWFLNEKEIAGANTKSFQATELGRYIVLVVDANGCSSASDPYELNSFDPVDEFIVYPNPNNGSFHIKVPNGVQILELKVYDIFKQLVYRSLTGLSDVDLPSYLSTGIYFLEIKSEGYKEQYTIKKLIVKTDKE